MIIDTTTNEIKKSNKKIHFKIRVGTEIVIDNNTEIFLTTGKLTYWFASNILRS